MIPPPRTPPRGLKPVEFATLDWIDWFNNRRTPEPNEVPPPVQARTAYGRQTEHTALAPRVRDIGLRRSCRASTQIREVTCRRARRFRFPEVAGASGKPGGLHPPARAHSHRGSASPRS